MIWESLITSTFVDTSEKTVSTYSGRKISDYFLLVILINASENDTRNSFTLPTQLFRNSTTKIYCIDTNSGVNGESFHQNTFRYVNDTSIALKRAAGIMQYMEIIGLKYGNPS